MRFLRGWCEILSRGITSFCRGGGENCEFLPWSGAFRQGRGPKRGPKSLRSVKDGGKTTEMGVKCGENRPFELRENVENVTPGNHIVTGGNQRCTPAEKTRNSRRQKWILRCIERYCRGRKCQKPGAKARDLRGRRVQNEHRKGKSERFSRDLCAIKQ